MNVGDLVKFAGDIFDDLGCFAARHDFDRYGVISDDTVVTLLVHGSDRLFPTNTVDFTLRHLRDNAEVISESG